MRSSNRVFLIGRYPPPVDGQALATSRLANLLENDFQVERVNLEPPGDAVLHRAPVRAARIQHFLSVRKHVSAALARDASATVVWPSISPSLLGHLRDRIVVLPAVHQAQRLVAVVHRGDFDRLFRRPFLNASARRLVDRTARFVFLTNKLSVRCSSWIADEKRSVIPNTIDKELVFRADEVEMLRRDRPRRALFRGLFVANMIPSKGYLDVLEAGSRLIKAERRVELHFAGQWLSKSDEKTFQKRVDALGIREHVTHHGAVDDRNQLRRLYAMSDVFLLPTYYENEAQPLSIIEALNAGLPVVTTRHAGIPEMVTEGREALFVSREEPESIVKAIERLMKEEVWAGMSANARRRFEDVFAASNVLHAWTDLLNEVQASVKAP